MRAATGIFVPLHRKPEPENSCNTPFGVLPRLLPVIIESTQNMAFRFDESELNLARDESGRHKDGETNPLGPGQFNGKRKMASRKSKLKRGTKGKRMWVASVKTDSTHPPPGLFTKSAETIAKTLRSKKVSPKGPGSGMRMLNYFINRAGKGLSAARRRELEKAKSLMRASGSE